MTRRTVGILTILAGAAVLVISINGFSASLLLKLAVVGFVGAILYFYASGNILGWSPNSDSFDEVPEPEIPTEGVFGTDLPDEALIPTEPEAKMVNLSRAEASSDAADSAANGNVIIRIADSEGDNDADDEVEVAEETEIKDLEEVSEEPAIAEEPEPVATRPIFAPHDDDEADQDQQEAEAEIQDDADASDANELVPAAGQELNGAPSNGVTATNEPVFLELEKYSNAELAAVVRDGEKSLINTLSESGVLSKEGPLTQTDVNTMVFVAVSSDDLIRALMAGKAAEEEAKALSHSPDTPELYQPADDLVESLT